MSDESVAQPPNVEWAIVVGFSGISAVAVVGALLLLRRYALVEDQASGRRREWV